MFRPTVLFNGLDASGHAGLWVTNGTAAGTFELTGISGAASFGTNPLDLTAFGGEVLFNGTDASGQFGLWVTNGTAAGTHELTGISGANAGGLNPSEMKVFRPPSAHSAEVLFAGVNTSDHTGLWVT